MAFFTVAGHSSQYMPGTDSVTVFTSARAADEARARKAISKLLRSMISPLVQKRCVIRIREHDEEQRSDHPEADLVAAPDLWHCACGARLAGLRWHVDALPGERERDKRYPDEQRAVGLKKLQIGQPRPADADTHEDERDDAARSGEQCGHPARGKRSRLGAGGGLGSPVNAGLNKRFLHLSSCASV